MNINEQFLELCSAERDTNIEEVKRFLEKNPDVNISHKDDKGYNALMYASANKNDNRELVDFLIFKGIDINNIASDRKTALRIAKFNGNTKIFNKLLEVGARDHNIEKLRVFKADTSKMNTNSVMDILKNVTYSEEANPNMAKKVEKFYDYLSENADQRTWLILTSGALFALDDSNDGRGLEIFMSPYNNISSMTTREAHKKTLGMFYSDKNAMLIANLDNYVDGATTLAHEITHKIRRTLPRKEIERLLVATIDSQNKIKRVSVGPGRAMVENEMMLRIEHSLGYNTIESRLEEFIADVPRVLFKSKSENIRGLVKGRTDNSAKESIEPLIDFFDKSMKAQLIEFIANHPKAKYIKMPLEISRDIEEARKLKPVSVLDYINKDEKEFYEAIEKHDINKVKSIIKNKNIDLNRNTRQISLLNFSIINGAYDIAKLLIDNGANLNKELINGYTPIFLTILSKHSKWDKYCNRNNRIDSEEFLRELLKKGANINHRSKEGITSLMVATTKGNTQNIVKCLLENGADVNMKDIYGNSAREYSFIYGNDVVGNWISQKQYELATPQNKKFIEAAKFDDIDTLKMLLGKNIDINTRDEKGYTALFYAVQNENVELVNILIERGANINVTNNYGRSVIAEAVKTHKEDMFKLLYFMNRSKDERDYSGKDLTIHAAESGNMNALNQLLSDRKNPNTFDNQLRTPLIHAIMLNRDEAAHTLVRNGANINQEDVFGITPLICATIKNNLETTDIVLKRGARVDKKDNWKNEPMKYAVENGNIDMVKLLYSYGADINVRSGSGKSYIEIARERGHTRMVDVLMNPSLLKTNENAVKIEPNLTLFRMKGAIKFSIGL